MTPRRINKTTAPKLKPLAEGLALIEEYKQEGTYQYVTVGQPVTVKPRVGAKFAATVTKIIARDGVPVEVEVVNQNRLVRTVLPQYVEGKMRKGQE